MPPKARRIALALTLVICASASSLHAQDLSKVETYLNALTTLEAPFLQNNADGTQSHGRLYLRRPGKLRIEYDKPSGGGLILAGGGAVAIFDDRGDPTPQQFPIGLTPLGPLLAKRIDLAAAGLADDIRDDESQVSFVASDPHHPDFGSIRLVFDKAPMRLASFAMTDAEGRLIQTLIGPDQIEGSPLSISLFSIPLEIQKRGSKR